MRRLTSLALVGAVAWCGCAMRLPEPRSPTMVRSFQGTLVPGYYVSPAAYEHYIRAQLLSNEGRAEEAAEELRQALASDGASAYLRARLAEELLALGRVDEAREEVEAALHLDPRFAEAYVDLARVHMRLGDNTSAEGALRHAVEIDHACEEAYLTLVNLYRERGLDARVDETWRQMVRWVPNSPQAHQALGHVAAAHGDVKRAEVEWRRALELDGGLQEARVELAELIQADGRFGEAEVLLREAYERSGDVKIAEMLVRLEMAAGRSDEARALCDRLDDEGGAPDRRLLVGWLRLAAKQPARGLASAELLLRGGESAGARLLAGAALEALHRADEALAQLRRILPTASEYATAQGRIGRLLRDGGRYREAVEVLAKAITSLASAGGVSDSLQELLAQVHERAGDGPRAVTLLEGALARRPQSETLAFALAAVYQRAGQWERAIATAKRVLQRDPESAQALNFVGYVLCEQGAHLDEARRFLERAQALKPSSGEILDSLGWLAVKQERLDDAERLLVRADRLAPEEPEILEHLGALYVKKADRTRALEVYRRALGLNPDERVRHVVEEQILLLETGRVGSR